MSVQVRRRRETAAFLSTFVGAQGELLIDTTNNRVQVHDGTTPGGWPAAKLVEVAQRTAVADASYTALLSDRTIAYTSLTAARTVMLPSAATYPTGTQLLVADESGACSAINTLTLARSGSDTINGASAAVLTIPYGYLALASNGAAKWTIVDQSLSQASGLTPATGRYIRASLPNGTGTVTLSGVADRLDLYPYIPGFDLSADRVGINVTTGVASALAKIVVYASDAQGRPDKLVMETGTLDCSAAAAVESSIALTLRKATQYWVCVRCSSTATLSAFANYTTPDLDASAIGAAPGKAVRRTLAFATAAPANWSYVASETVSASVPAVWFRSI